jgi:hypothetical protein
MRGLLTRSRAMILDIGGQIETTCNMEEEDTRG